MLRVLVTIILVLTGITLSTWLLVHGMLGHSLNMGPMEVFFMGLCLTFITLNVMLDEIDFRLEQGHRGRERTEQLGLLHYKTRSYEEIYRLVDKMEKNTYGDD